MLMDLVVQFMKLVRCSSGFMLQLIGTPPELSLSYWYMCRLDKIWFVCLLKGLRTISTWWEGKLRRIFSRGFEHKCWCRWEVQQRRKRQSFLSAIRGDVCGKIAAEFGKFGWKSSVGYSSYWMRDYIKKKGKRRKNGSWVIRILCCHCYKYKLCCVRMRI